MISQSSLTRRNIFRDLLPALKDGAKFMPPLRVEEMTKEKMENDRPLPPTPAVCLLLFQPGNSITNLAPRG